MRNAVRIACLAMIGTAPLYGAGEGEEEMNSKVYVALEREAFQPKLAWNAQTPEEHQEWRRSFRSKLSQLLGRNPEQVPLEFVWDETVETEAFTRRKVYVRTEKDYWAPAYYFLPKGIEEPRPAILCFHGHSGILPYIREGTEEQKKKGRDHSLDYAVHFAEQGTITLAVVQRGWNETRHEDPHSCQRLSRAGFMIGRTPIGMRVWDAMRMVDFLETREEVDASRIGAAGLSGGGTTTLFFAAMEDRVQLAMVAGYFCTFRESIYSIHHCICNCVPDIMLWGEMSDVAALIAPRPLLVISGTEDPIFPIEATKSAYETLSKTYDVLGASDRLESDFFEGVHEWSNRKTSSFLEKHFAR